MKSTHLKENFERMVIVLDEFNPDDWGDIVLFLKQIKSSIKPSIHPDKEDIISLFARGTGFITFSYGIDGVSVEISKYGHTLFNLFKAFEGPSIHLIGGNFDPQVVSMVGEDVKFYELKGIDGWDKWDDGKWFNALYRKEMKSFGEESQQLTKEIYDQAIKIAKDIGEYFLENKIYLVIPVNVASNPGNLALTLGLVFATEFLGTYVLNSNHDFYWEAGKPTSEREPDEKPGVRDHFFRNIKNKSFFSLFRMLYPWNGTRWLQVNINKRQSQRLINRFGFSKHKVSEISTCIGDSFFEAYDETDVASARQRMGLILSNGEKVMSPVPIEKHLLEVDQWMGNQKPIILGSRAGLSVDPKSVELIILLQPTRIVSRKRIYRNFELIGSLFKKSKLKKEFEINSNKQLILHITGPVPMEHQKDLEDVLSAYKDTILSLSGNLAERIFISFSVGHEFHTSFAEDKFAPLTIEEIYRMADAIVFPSETEGRGLPIIEACASGIPIVCSHYRPKQVFRDVIGEKLPTKQQIKYTMFPEGRLKRDFLSEVAEILIDPGSQKGTIVHNREAVRIRYGQESFTNKFVQLLNQLVKEN